MKIWINTLVLKSGLVLSFGAPWPAPDGKAATFDMIDPETKRPKQYALPATIGPIFFIDDESSSGPDPEDGEGTLTSVDSAVYEVWANPTDEASLPHLGNKFVKGPVTRCFRVPRSSVLFAEEIWPIHEAMKEIHRHSEDDNGKEQRVPESTPVQAPITANPG